MEEPTDRLEGLLLALRAGGVHGRTVRRRAAATVGLILLVFALVAVTGLYTVALSGLAVLVCSPLAALAIVSLRRRRATIVLRARVAWTAAWPVLSRTTHELVTAARRLWARRPDASRVLALKQPTLTRLARLASSARATAVDVRIGDRVQRAAELGRALAAHVQPAPRGAEVREALRLNAAGAELRRAGAFAEAAERHRQALDVFDELGDRRSAALTKNNLALALDRAGDDTAIELFEEAATTLGALGDEQSEGQVIANLAVVLRRRGQEQRAEDALLRALEKLEEHSPEYHQVEALRRAS